MRLQWFLFCAVLLVIPACSDTGLSTSARPAGGDEPSSTAKSPGDAPLSPADSPGSTPEITAVVKTMAEVNKLIAAHTGKVVVVDLWALW